MSFQQSSFFKGVENHKAVDRDPNLPDGRHRVRIKECVRFLSRDNQPVSIARVQLVSSNAPEAVVGETYGCGFFLNSKFPYYFFTEIKRFVTAATGGTYNDENTTAEVLELMFPDRDNEGAPQPLADHEIDIVVTTNEKDGKSRTKTDFRAIPQAT